MLSLQHIAKVLGGVVSGGRVLAPGPGHSAIDKSMSIKIDPAAPDGFLVHSYAGDDDIVCKDYVRDKLGLQREPWKPRSNGRGNGHDRAIAEANQLAREMSEPLRPPCYRRRRRLQPRMPRLQRRDRRCLRRSRR